MAVKYTINMNLIGDPVNYGFVGYEGMKRKDLENYFEEKLRAKQLYIGKSHTIVDCNDNLKGSYAIESIAV